MSAAIGVAALTSVGDIAIKILYDERYQQASWMLPILLMGSWFSILASVNKSALLGFGKPLYSAAANGCKFGWLLVGFPLGIAHFGTLGAISVVALADLFRYLPAVFGLKRERFSFFLRDSVATLSMIALIAFLESTRWYLGFATSFDGVRLP